MKNAPADANRRAVEIGQDAPEFTLHDVDEKKTEALLLPRLTRPRFLLPICCLISVQLQYSSTEGAERLHGIIGH